MPTVPTKDPGRRAFQYLDGPGLDADWITTVGVRYVFD